MQGIIISTNEAAATLIVGTDAFRNERKRVSSRLRKLTGVAIVGGNAINEAAVDIYIEDFYVGRFLNSLNGAVSPIMPDHFQAIAGKAVPPGSQITGVIGTAPTVSPLIIHLYGEEF